MILATKQSIQTVEFAARLYAIDHDGDYPENLEQLIEPQVVNGREVEPYLAHAPQDAWKNPIQYHPPQPGDRPLIVSFGPDKLEGGGDDITNLDDDRTE